MCVVLSMNLSVLHNRGIMIKCRTLNKVVGSLTKVEKEYLMLWLNETAYIRHMIIKLQNSQKISQNGLAKRK